MLNEQAIERAQETKKQFQNTGLDGPDVLVEVYSENERMVRYEHVGINLLLDFLFELSFRDGIIKAIPRFGDLPDLTQSG